MVLKRSGSNTEGKDDLISFFFRLCCWVNAWGCFYHNLKKKIFKSCCWAKIWWKTLGCIWKGLDCLISFFFMFSYRWVRPWRCFFFNLFYFLEVFLLLGHFWAPHNQILVWNLPDTPQKAWVVQFISPFLIHVERLQGEFSWGFVLILF